VTHVVEEHDRTVGKQWLYSSPILFCTGIRMVAVDLAQTPDRFRRTADHGSRVAGYERNVIGGSYVEPKAAAQDRLPRCQT